MGAHLINSSLVKSDISSVDHTVLVVSRAGSGVWKLRRDLGSTDLGDLMRSAVPVDSPKGETMKRKTNGERDKRAEGSDNSGELYGV